jgi:hypothetical protein
VAGKTWSLVGAARFAREARTSMAAHMQTAAIARQWRKSKMMRAYDVHATNFRSREAARAMLFGGLGYRPPYPAGWDEAADLVILHEARCLAAAGLYVITPQMCDVVIAAAQSLTVDDLKLVDEEDLPSPTGLLVVPGLPRVGHLPSPSGLSRTPPRDVVPLYRAGDLRTCRIPAGRAQDR